MHAVAAHAQTPSRAALWTGRVVQVIVVLFLLMDAGMKVANSANSIKYTLQLGYSAGAVVPIGAVLLILTILYVIPQTAIFGAVALTGYLGGAVASQVRIGAPAFNDSFPIIFAILMWGALYLRDERLRSLVPLKK